MSEWLSAITGRTERKAAQRARAEDRAERGMERAIEGIGKFGEAVKANRESDQEQSNWQNLFDKQSEQWTSEQETAAENLATQLKLQYGEGVDIPNPFDTDSWPDELKGTPLHRQWVEMVNTEDYRNRALDASRDKGKDPSSLYDAFYTAVGVVSDVYGKDEEGGALFESLVKDPEKADELRAAFVDAMKLDPAFLGNEEAANALFNRMLAGELPVTGPGVIDDSAGSGRGGGGGSSWGDEDRKSNVLTEFIDKISEKLNPSIEELSAEPGGLSMDPRSAMFPEPPESDQVGTPQDLLPAGPEPAAVSAVKEAPNTEYAASLTEAVKATSPILPAVKEEQTEMLNYISKLAEVDLTDEEKNEIDSMMEPFYSEERVGLGDYQFINDYLSKISQRGRYKL